MDRTKLFVSYSHTDRPWLDRLRTHLAVLERLKLVHVWSDTQIEVGANWQAIIDEQLTESRLAVLLLSPAFLASDYICEREMPLIVKHQEQENGLEILPLVAKPCAWRLVDKLSQLQARPVDGRALSIGTDAQIDLDLTAFVYEVATRLPDPVSKLAVRGWESARLASSLSQQYERIGLQIASPRAVDLAVHSSLDDILGSLTPSSWIGEYKAGALEIRFRLKITERTGINFKGEIEYVNDKTFTSVDGHLMGKDWNTMTDRLWVQIANRVGGHIALVFRETDYVSGKENSKISFDGEYRAILSLGQMSGAWVSQNRLVGWFRLEPEVEP